MSAQYSKVIVFCQADGPNPVRDITMQSFFAAIRTHKRDILTNDFAIEAAYIPALPEEKKESLQAFVWAVQEKQGMDRGGPWNADFYEKGGLHFMVLYLG